jgi:hypothetical protein
LQEVFTSEKLSATYQTPVEVVLVHGHLVTLLRSLTEIE